MTEPKTTDLDNWLPINTNDEKLVEYILNHDKEKPDDLYIKKIRARYPELANLSEDKILKMKIL